MFMSEVESIVHSKTNTYYRGQRTHIGLTLTM